MMIIDARLELAAETRPTPRVERSAIAPVAAAQLAGLGWLAGLKLGYPIWPSTRHERVKRN